MSRHPDPANKVHKRYLRRLVKGTLFGFLLIIVAALSALAGFYVSIDHSAPSVDLASARGSSETTRIFDDADPPTLLAELHGVENRRILSPDEIPQIMRDAIVAIEDERFYVHQGVDFRGILRAAWANIRSKDIVQGGSTITQQYIKNAYITDEKTMDRKLREAVLAYQLEKQWSKQKILSEYLNTIYFGSGAYGIEAAAEEYYGVHAAELSLGQAALLAGLPKAPSAYSPRRDPDKALQRRDLVLNRMYQQHYITSAQLQGALDEPLGLVEKANDGANDFPYWVEMVREQLVACYGSSTVLEGGLEVRVSIDLDLQKQAEAAVADVLDQPGDPSAALVSIDVHTGRLLAMVGGSDFSVSQFNLATQGRRQPGSAFKPFVLVTALKQGISPDALYESGPLTVALPDGEWKVSSVDKGLMSLTEATATSSNGVYARLIMELGADSVAQTAYDMGIQTSLGKNPNPAIALGGLTTGVSPLEMAMAYATLATGGERLSSSDSFTPEGTSLPVTIVRVTDADGRTLAANEVVKSRVLDANTAALATQCLETVISKGTGTAADIGRPAAGKTGTTQNYADAWFVGYTPDIVTAVWVGYPSGQKPMTNVHGIKVTGGSLPAQIWAAYMKEAVKDLPVSTFAPQSSDGWKTVEVCSESRLLPTDACPKIIKVRFAEDSVPTETCNLHTREETPDERQTPVPDVVGMKLADAKTVLRQAGFDVSVDKDTSSTEIAGTVLRQDPRPDSGHLRGTTVSLTVSAQADRPTTTATVPNLIGLDGSAAVAALREAGLKAKLTETTDDSPAGLVIAQDVTAGTQIAQGSTIGLTISSGADTPETSTSRTTSTPGRSRSRSTPHNTPTS